MARLSMEAVVQCILIVIIPEFVVSTPPEVNIVLAPLDIPMI